MGREITCFSSKVTNNFLTSGDLMFKERAPRGGKSSAGTDYPHPQFRTNFRYGQEDHTQSGAAPSQRFRKTQANAP
jgi:hypothetical protein